MNDSRALADVAAMIGIDQVEMASCVGKPRFPNSVRAYRVAQQIHRRRSRKRRKAAAETLIYRCPHCGGWHLGAELRPPRQ